MAEAHRYVDTTGRKRGTVVVTVRAGSVQLT
ncbi:MAG: hypothetical protein ACM3ZE_09940 [Myxococcales bacterium]